MTDIPEPTATSLGSPSSVATSAALLAAAGDAEAPPAAAHKYGGMQAGWRDGLMGWLLMLPALLLVVPFKLVPLILLFWDSLRKFNSFSPGSHFVGAANYTRIAHDPTARAAFLHAFEIVLSLPIWVLLPLVLAVLIFNRTPGWRLWRSFYFLPYTIAPIVVGIMFRQILDPSGPLNSLLKHASLGALALPWLSDQHTALGSLVAIALWSFFGLGVLTYLSGLAALPDDVLEAATLDGAGYWTRLLRIILPLLRPVVGYWTVLCASGLLIWMFPLIYALTQGGPGVATMLPEYYVFQQTFSFLNIGYGTAIGVVLFAFVGLISAFTIRFMYRQGGRQTRRGM